MEHILQFAIGIDDEAIIKRVEAGAENAIMQEIKRDAKAAIFKSTYPNSSTFSRNPTDFFDEKIGQFLKENKDEIIKLTANRLAERLAKTKAAKELKEVKK